jgi:hypothetical protein
MKAFQLEINGETEIIAAETNIHALRFYCDLTGIGITDSDFSNDDTIIEIPEKKWKKLKVRNTDYDEKDPEDKPEWTLEELMKGLVSPDLISTTVQ